MRIDSDIKNITELLKDLYYLLWFSGYFGLTGMR